jgi:OOP family OmpA-OmpF porin
MRSRAILASLALLLWARAARADPVPSLDLRSFHAPIDPASGVWVTPADTSGTGEWNAGVWLSYAFRPVTLRDATTKAISLDVIEHQVTSDVVASVGLWHRLQLGIDVPILIYQTGDKPTAAATAAIGAYTIPSQAFGDLGLDAKLTILRPTAGEAGGFALALHERLSVPTGDTASFMGEGAVTNEARLLGEYRRSALGLYAGLGFTVRGHHEDFACGSVGVASCTSRFGNELPFGLGVSFRPQALGIDAKGRMTWFVEMNGYLPAGPLAPFTSTAASSLTVDAAVRVAVGGDVSVLAGLATSPLGGVGNAPVQGLLSVSWAPRVHDRDGDGIPDDIDQCPDLPEDFDGFQDADGCPDLDNDQDGIPDKLDKCPNTKGELAADGCPVLDHDHDGIPDTEDACPSEPGPPDPDPKKNGCPIREKVDPDKDSDGDGIPDREDACPTVKGIRSTNPKENGCPDPDPDKDTYVGDEDKCPNDPETWNGYQDADGCPDTPPQKRPPLVVVKEGPAGATMALSRKVTFTPTNEVDAPSVLLLRAVASQLLWHPSWTLRVGVRPSPRGGAAEAEARTNAVVAWLRKLARRDQAAEAAGWDAVKGAPRAAEHGLGLVPVARVAKP